MEYKKPKATLLSASPLVIGEIAGRVCYDSFDLSENELVHTFRDNPEYLAELLEKGYDIKDSKLLDKLINVFFHESVAEHINLTFHVEDISREVIIEWNRTRIGMPTSQKSSRYTIEGLIEAWIDWNEAQNGTDIDLMDLTTDKFTELVKLNSVHEDDDLISITSFYISGCLTRYNEEEPLKKGLKGGTKKRQNDRVKRCLPESWMTEGIWTFNLRSLKHFLELRSSGSAYYGIREIAEALKEQTPHKYRILIDKKYRKEYFKDSDENKD